MGILADDIKQEHRRAELERLRAGFDGCGCQLCQEFYKTLDLSKYGRRVLRYTGGVVIIEGKSGADKYEQYHRLDRWVKYDTVFITEGQGYTVSKSGATVCIGPVDDSGDPLKVEK